MWVWCAGVGEGKIALRVNETRVQGAAAKMWGRQKRHQSIDMDRGDSSSANIKQTSTNCKLE